jgi:hypothetical protein
MEALIALQDALDAGDNAARDAALAAALDDGHDLVVLAAMSSLSPESAKTYARKARRAVGA